ncbi:MAG: PRC-barrel domain-containing protein [Candidatus Latescibacterota bacterium]
MLRKAKDIIGYTVSGAEGELGKVEDLYFDEEFWIIRYLRVDVGRWFMNRKTLVSTAALRETNGKERSIGADLFKEKIRQSPEVDFGRPISREKEEEINAFFQWPVYWDINRYPEYPGVTEREYPEIRKPGYHGAVRGYYSPSVEEEERKKAGEEAIGGAEFHIRGAKDIIGGPVQATDGEIGHVSDLIVDSDSWAVRYVEVDTRNILPGKHVLVLPQMVMRINWDESRVFITVRKDVVKLAPEYDSDRLPDRTYEESLYEYYTEHSY